MCRGRDRPLHAAHVPDRPVDLQPQARARAAAGRPGALMDVRMLTVGPVQENCFLARRDGADRGARSSTRARRPTRCSARSTSSALKLEAILLTHTHFDHVGAVAPVARATGAPVYCPELEREVLANIMDFVPLAGLRAVRELRGRPPRRRRRDARARRPRHRRHLHPGPLARPRHLLDRRRAGPLLRRRAVPELDRPHGPAGRRHADADARRSPGCWTRCRARRASLPGHMGLTTLERERATNPFLQELVSR